MKIKGETMKSYNKVVAKWKKDGGICHICGESTNNYESPHWSEEDQTWYFWCKKCERAFNKMFDEAVNKVFRKVKQ